MKEHFLIFLRGFFFEKLVPILFKLEFSAFSMESICPLSIDEYLQGFVHEVFDIKGDDLKCNKIKL